ncbi:MAG: N-acetylmannosamine-6-phosphate 2-epimerase [Erysipelotrichaceae bacterium]|nr:N-acetylmannosamine-6-phosphate 2-epimerase [Erysipelotrichaceae bacterium]
MDLKEIKSILENGLVVSCQALPHEPMYTEEGGVMPLFAKAAVQAGAIAIRANSVRDIKQIKEVVDVPVIGIIKIDYPPTSAYITPSMKEIDELVEAKADIIALDCTRNTRKDGQTAVEFIKEIKQKYPNQLLMADISNLQEALDAYEAKIDFVGTTLNGYMEGDVLPSDPNYQLVMDIHNANKDIPIIAEGRIHTPEQAVKMLECGAFCVVVGGAITRPLEIAKRFFNEIKEYK